MELKEKLYNILRDFIAESDEFDNSTKLSEYPFCFDNLELIEFWMNVENKINITCNNVDNFFNNIDITVKEILEYLETTLE